MPGGVAVAAAVSSSIMDPVGIHAPVAQAAVDQPGWRVATGMAVLGPASGAGGLDGDEVSLTNVGCAIIFEITHSWIGFHRRTARRRPTRPGRAAGSVLCRFHTCRPV
jgi:hypothetical protein